MIKLVQYFTDKKKGYPSVVFPSFTSLEEKEVLTQLGLPYDAFNEKNAEEVICGTVARMSQYGPAASLLARAKEGDSRGADCMEVGTIRIKRGDEEVIGTVCMKNDEEFGTIKFYGTVKITEDGDTTYNTNPDSVPEWANFGTLKICRDLESGSIRVQGQDHVQKDEEHEKPNFLFSKAPEQWELNILSLEHGEWNSGMNKDAFGKYKKERPALTGLFKPASVPVTDLVLPIKDKIGSDRATRNSSFERLGKVQKQKTSRSPHSPHAASTPCSPTGSQGMKKSKSALDKRGWVGTPKKSKTNV